MLVATEYYITTAARLFLHLLHFAAIFHVNRETAKRTGLYNPRDDVVGLLPPVPHRAAAAATTTTRPACAHDRRSWRSSSCASARLVSLLPFSRLQYRRGSAAQDFHKEPVRMRCAD